MTAIHTKIPIRVGQIVAVQHPAFGNGPTTLLWAYNGLVAFEDHRTGKTGTMSWQDAAKRTLAVSQMMPQAHEDPKKHFRYERERQVKFLEAMVEVIREARAHGGPHDDNPFYDRYHRRQRGKTKVQINDNFLVERGLLRKGQKQANGVVRLGSCDF